MLSVLRCCCPCLIKPKPNRKQVSPNVSPTSSGAPSRSGSDTVLIVSELVKPVRSVSFDVPDEGEKEELNLAQKVRILLERVTTTNNITMVEKEDDIVLIVPEITHYEKYISKLQGVTFTTIGGEQFTIHELDQEISSILRKINKSHYE